MNLLQGRHMCPPSVLMTLPWMNAATPEKEASLHYETNELLKLLQSRPIHYTLGRPLIRDILLYVFWKIPPAGGPIL